MATSTKESGPVTSLPQDSGPLSQKSGPNAQNDGGQRPARAGAIGAEIPVVIHASRHSVSEGVNKALPPLHEEAHTAIVFPQGCVVRLSASLVVGELIVLTNRKSGADALCRVIGTKTRPGTQNYVDLEFTQRAAGFWGECFKAASPKPTESFKPAPALPTAVNAPAIVSPAQRPESASPLAVDAVSPAGNAVPHRDQPSSVQAAPPYSKSVLDASAGLPTPQSLHPGESTAASAVERARPNSMILAKGSWAAAAALLVIGLTAGGFLLGRRGRSVSPETPAEVAAALTVPTQTAGATQANRLPVSEALESGAEGPVAAAPLTATSLTVNRAETSTEELSPFERTQENSRSALPLARPSAIGVGKIAKPMARIGTRAGVIEPPPVLQARGNNLAEEMLVSGALSGTGRTNALEPPTSVAAANPMARPGGQLQPPEPVAMPAPIYPAYAREMHVHGVVAVDASVDATGKVTKVKVVSGPVSLQEAAMEAVLQFRYRPAQLNGQPVATHINVDISFTHD